MYTIQLSTPITVGTYPNQYQVSFVKLASISVNFQGVYSTQGIAKASFLLEDLSGNQIVNTLFSDTESLTLIQKGLASTDPTLGITFEQAILARCQAATDPVSGLNLLPTGTLVIIPSITAISPSPITKNASAQTLTFTGSDLQTGYGVIIIDPTGTKTTFTNTQLTTPTNTGFSLSMIVNTSGTWSIQTTYSSGLISDIFTFTA